MAGSIKPIVEKQIAPEKIGDLAADLESLEEVPKKVLNLRDAISALLPQLQEAKSKGHSYETLCRVLEGRGISTTPATLQQYMSNAKKSSRKKKRTSKRKPVTRTPAEGAEIRYSVPVALDTAYESQKVEVEDALSSDTENKSEGIKERATRARRRDKSSEFGL